MCNHRQQPVRERGQSQPHSHRNLRKSSLTAVEEAVAAEHRKQAQSFAQAEQAEAEALRRGERISRQTYHQRNRSALVHRERREQAERLVLTERQVAREALLLSQAAQSYCQRSVAAEAS